MRKTWGFALLILAFLAAAPGAAQGRQITDLAGRRVAVPDKIRKVYCMSPTCQVLMYTLAPDLLAGWNYQPTPGEKALLVAPYRDLPVLGGWFGRNNTGNIEEIMKIHPDAMISIGDPMAVSVAERVEKQTGLPVLIGDWSLEKLADDYRLLGALTGRQARAQQLAEYCARTLARIKAKVAGIPEAQKRRVYYAEGPKGLSTDPGGSAHSQSIVFAGGHNVAEVQDDHGYGEIPVSMEQILSWNPEIVIAGYDHEMSPGAFYRGIWSDPLWQQVKAVKERAVYEAPQFPFNWIDRPPSANRVIGILWLANIFYPDRFHDNLRKETRKFYKLFYHRALSESELSVLLAQTVKHGDKVP